MISPLLRSLACVCILFAFSTNRSPAADLPNIVLIFTDDQGYADVGSFGAGGFETPHLDRLAEEGRWFPQFYVAQAVCSASRAALLTGCYPNRIGFAGALGPSSRMGIHSNEMTIAELVKQKGYATAAYGKWHLGHHPEFLPMRHGFDDYFGLPYSNDMWPFHPETAPGRWPDLPLIDGEEIVDAEVLPEEQEQLTTQYTQKAVEFIDGNSEGPFFLYLAHSMPHVPLYVSDKFEGKSAMGIYGDVIMEIDWSVGEVMMALERNGIAEDTLVIYTSDNGPWLSYGTHAGSAHPLREGKGTSWEGGVRVPCIMRWPGKIPAGTVSELPAMTIDILPTIAHLIGGALPDHPIDGRNIWPLMAGEPDAVNPHDAYFVYYNRNDLQAVISGDGEWKLVFPHRYRTLKGRPGGLKGKPVKYESAESELELYNLHDQIDESRNRIGRYPEIAEKLQKLADGIREELGDNLAGVQGNAVREPGRLAE